MTPPDTNISTEVETHPVQVPSGYAREQARVPKVVTMQAYEVYCQVYGKQEALVTGGCRGGFGSGELVAFLYAYPFPRAEWSKRVDEAMKGMRGLG